MALIKEFHCNLKSAYFLQPKYTPFCHSFIFRPDLIDVLFLRSFPDSFQRVERDKNKNKRKNGHKIAWKCICFRKIIHLKRILFFPRFFANRKIRETTNQLSLAFYTSEWGSELEKDCENIGFFQGKNGCKNPNHPTLIIPIWNPLWIHPGFPP